MVRAALGHVDSGQPMSKKDPVYPDFIFGRRRAIEIEEGLALAGALITRYPRDQALTEPELATIKDLVHYLVDELRAGRLEDEGPYSLWDGGVNPEDAVEIPDIPEDLMKQWGTTCHIIPIRVARDGTTEPGTIH